LVVVADAEHFFVGKLDQVDAAIRGWVMERHPEIADQQL
jgi:alpha/beta superfamily hydrolase